MDKKTNMPHDDFSVEEILQEARLLREQQGEENAIPATEEDAKPAPEQMCIRDRSHGVGWCAPQQGACKLSLNVKDGIIEEALVETVGCSGMTLSLIHI